MPRRSLPLVVGLLLVALSSAGPSIAAEQRHVSALAAPLITGPAEGSTLTSFGPLLSWTNALSATQYHLQVIPFNNDGPGADIHTSSTDMQFRVPAPPEWYGLLPDMTYTWRVRVSDASVFLEPNDPAWSPWTERHFRTPAVTSATIGLGSPLADSAITSLTPTLAWTNSRPDVFYYELQLNKDPAFNTDPATATAMVYWVLLHGGVTNPPNSYAVPAAFPLEAGTAYYWRVRPRVQGDGTALAWPAAFRFSTAASATVPPATPTPTATVPSPTSTPTPQPTTTPTPGVPPAPGSMGKIAFQRCCFTTTDAEMYVMDPDGANAKNISQHPAWDGPAYWSPDATKIAFASQRLGNAEIYVMNADGTGLKNLTNHSAKDGASSLQEDWRTTWSPDGTKLAFVSDRDGNREIYVMNAADGSNLINLSNHPGDDSRPAWQPGGNKIAFHSQRVGGQAIYTINADGTGLTQLAEAIPEFVWSPDGKKLAYVGTESDTKLHVITVDGATVFERIVGGTPELAWSPDGKRIAYTTATTTSTRRTLNIINADGTGLRTPTLDDNEIRRPNWSPDSRMVLYSLRCGGNPNCGNPSHAAIYKFDADSLSVTRLTDHKNTLDDLMPTWSPK